jgi:hypothetical protein
LEHPSGFWSNPRKLRYSVSYDPEDIPFPMHDQRNQPTTVSLHLAIHQIAGQRLAARRAQGLKSVAAFGASYSQVGRLIPSLRDGDDYRRPCCSGKCCLGNLFCLDTASGFGNLQSPRNRKLVLIFIIAVLRPNLRLELHLFFLRVVPVLANPPEPHFLEGAAAIDPRKCQLSSTLTGGAKSKYVVDVLEAEAPQFSTDRP